MNIALVSEHASPLASLGTADGGGQNVYVASLARNLSARGHAVSVYTRRETGGDPAETITPDGYRVALIDAGPARAIPKDELYPLMPDFARRLAHDLAAMRFDVVHSHFWMSGIAARLATRAYAVPWVHTYHALGDEKRLHQGAADTSPGARIAEERTLLECADRVIATSAAEIFTHRRQGASAAKLRLVPCGVDAEFFSRRHLEAARPRSQRYRLVTVGRFVERKGIGDVIRALAHVPDTELVIVGGPSRCRLAGNAEAWRLLAIARESGVTERVIFTGGLDHRTMPAMLRSADTVILAPWYEPFGMVAVEAMASGAPVIASAVGGFLDTVVDGVTGFHVPPREPGAIAEAAARLLGDATLRVRMGLNGKDRARRLYTWAKISKDTELVYDEIARPSAVASATSA